MRISWMFLLAVMACTGLGIVEHYQNPEWLTRAIVFLVGYGLAAQQENKE